MLRIQATSPPDGSLIAPDVARSGSYTDAFRAVVAPPVSLPDFIAAFYATRLFSAERQILRLAGWTSTPGEIAELADGTRTAFAAWRVAARRPDEILLADTTGRTRSWLHAAPSEHGTALWFGSVIVPRPGRDSLGPAMRALIGPHRVYSRLLLAAAARDLTRQTRPR